jgi:hypothetical protein
LGNTFSLGFDLPEDWPVVSLNVSGDGKSVVTKGVATFAKPLPFTLEPWNVPTNLIHEPLHSFTAVQGLRPWLSEWSTWRDLKAGAPPNQLFLWGQGGTPFLDYAAAPLSDAAAAMKKLGPWIMDTLNPLLATNRMGEWNRATNSDGVVWNRVPIIFPFVQSVNLSEGNFLFSALSPAAVSAKPTPLTTLQELVKLPNVVYFEREITGPRVEAWMFVSQLFRIILRREQLPPNCNAVLWLRALGPLLNSSATTIAKTGPRELSLMRTSSVGLSAGELQLLADWLESARFPLRLHSSVATLPPFSTHRSGLAPGPSKQAVKKS